VERDIMHHDNTDVEMRIGARMAMDMGAEAEASTFRKRRQSTCQPGPISAADFQGLHGLSGTALAHQGKAWRLPQPVGLPGKRVSLRRKHITATPWRPG
jgi:hypothetical protein